MRANSPRRLVVREDPQRAAKRAGLHWVDDSQPGIARNRRGKSFVYVVHGRVIKSQTVLKRIKSLVIPPAWREVWICKDPRGHLQATGRDARGRKQYRYHPQWREVRDENKYERLLAFARALPKMRRKVAQHLRHKKLDREKVLATVVKLLETTLIRVGNDEYARQNQSFGITTMMDHHAEIKGRHVVFRFTGKSGVEHEIMADDSRLVPIVRQCQDLPGQQLLQYMDRDGKVRDVSSTDVNDYLREISGHDFTAKDFRTWAGTVLAARALQEFEDFDSHAAAKRNVTRAIESVAERLGNTTAVCRKCYVHPAIINAYLDRSLVQTLQRKAEHDLRTRLGRMPAEEAAVLALLQQRMERELH
jgi:DNA topoisomerase I